MKKYVLFMFMSMVALTLMAQNNPYTEYEFQPDTRLIYDYGFCIAMPERMVEDNSAKGFASYDRGFYDKESKAMLLIDYDEWDGKQTAKELVGSYLQDGYEYDKKCTLGTKSYAAKGSIGKYMAVVYAMIEQDAKQTCVIRYLYPSDYTFGAYATKYYISESYIDIKQDYANSSIRKEREQAKRNAAIEDSIATIKKEQVEKEQLRINAIQVKIEPIIKGNVKPAKAKSTTKKLFGAFANQIGGNVSSVVNSASGLMKNVKITYSKKKVTNVSQNSSSSISVIFEDGNSVADIDCADKFSGTWTDTYNFAYTCSYDDNKNAGFISLKTSDSEQSQQETIFLFDGILYKLSKEAKTTINALFFEE